MNLNNIEELKEFLAFINVHYELNDSWILSKQNFGTNWEGPYRNVCNEGNYLSPFYLDPDIIQKKRNSVEDILIMYKKVKQ